MPSDGILRPMLRPSGSLLASSRAAQRRTVRLEVGRLATDAIHAILLAPHNPAVAKALLRPVMDRLPRLIAGGVSYLPDPLFAAAAVIEPSHAVALIEHLPTEKNPLRRQGWAPQRILVARVLAASDHDLKQIAQQLTG